MTKVFLDTTVTGEEKYTIKDLVVGLGIPRERLKEWIGRGYIKPAFKVSRGSREFSYYSVGDLYRIALFDYMVTKIKLSRELSSRAISSWAKIPDLSRINFSTVEYVCFYQKAEELQAKFVFKDRSDYDAVFVINFKGIYKTVRKMRVL